MKLVRYESIRGGFSFTSPRKVSLASVRKQFSYFIVVLTIETCPLDTARSVSLFPRTAWMLLLHLDFVNWSLCDNSVFEILDTLHRKKGFEITRARKIPNFVWLNSINSKMFNILSDLRADTVFQIPFPFFRFHVRCFLNFIPLDPNTLVQDLLTVFISCRFLNLISVFEILFLSFFKCFSFHILFSSVSFQYSSIGFNSIVYSIWCYHFSSFHSVLPL